jgi:hypothetical protein
MVIRLSRTVDLRNGRSNEYSASFAVPGISPDLTVVYDSYSDSRFRIEWRDTEERLFVSHGKIEVKYRDQVQFSTDIEEGFFPPTRNGALMGDDSTLSGYYQGLTVVVELHVTASLSDQLEQARSRLEASAQRVEGSEQRCKAAENRARVAESETMATRTTFAISSSSAFPLSFLPLLPILYLSQALILLHVGFTAARLPGDVCFVFPRSGQQLWANEAFLSSANSYLEGILSSDFLEGTASTVSSPRGKANLAAYAFEESDEETDKIEAKKGASSKKKEKKVGEPFKTVTITDTAYSTYLAVLVWLQSRHITFAPLLSHSRTSGNSRSNSVISHTLKVSRLQDQSSALLPPPSSPKSIYRLAHLLEIDELASLALVNLLSQLTPEIAAYELYSDVSTAYSAVRDVVLDYVVDHWEEVKQAESTAEMEEKALSGELEPGAAGAAMLLARRTINV